MLLFLLLQIYRKEIGYGERHLKESEERRHTKGKLRRVIWDTAKFKCRMGKSWLRSGKG